MLSLFRLCLVCPPLISLLLLAGCGTEPALAPVNPPMRIATSYWPGQYWVDLAHQKGWFSEEGLTVKVIDTTADFYASCEDMREGDLDAQCFVLYDLALYNAEGNDLVMVLCTDVSVGADQIIARPGIESLQDLKGRTVGVASGTASEYMLQYVLDQCGLAPDDYNQVDMQSERAAAELALGHLDAVCTWEPFASEAKQAVGGVQLWDSSMIYGALRCGYVFQRSFIESRPEDVSRFVRVWHRATLYLQQHPQEVFSLIAAVYGKPAAEVARLAALDPILDLPDNRLAFSYTSGVDSLHSSFRHVNDFMLSNSITRVKLDSSRLLDPRFINALDAP